MVKIHDALARRAATATATIHPIRPSAPNLTGGDLHPVAAAAINRALDNLRNVRKPWTHGAAWDDATFRNACTLVHVARSHWSGYTLDQAEADLYAYAPADERWGRTQHEAKWRQAIQFAPDGWPEPLPWETPEAFVLRHRDDEPTISSDEEAEFWSSRSLLHHLHCFAKARRASPWAVLGVTLARVVVGTPPNVYLPPLIGGRGSLNMFVGLVGPSGVGKGISEAAAADAFDVGSIRSGRIASGEAIAHVFKKRERGFPEPIWRDESHAALIRVSEIDRLAGQANRQGSTIMADLRSAWSGELLGQVAADASRSIPLEDHEYRLCMVAGIQPHRAEILLDDADGGTPQRFLWLPARDEHMPDRRPYEPASLRWRPPVSAGFANADIPIAVCETARNAIDAAHVARHRGEGEALDGHALQCRLKVAAALALADSRVEVTEDDWDLSDVIMRKSSQTRAEVQAALKARAQQEVVKRVEATAAAAVAVEERQAEEAERRVLRKLLARLGAEWIGRAEWRRGISSRDRPYFDGAVEQLLATGQIEASDEGGHGVQARYRRTT